MPNEKLYITTTESAQTLKNKTISAADNTISGIDTGNLAAKVAADAGKTFLVKSDGTWELAKVATAGADNVTIDLNASNQFEVMNGSATTGLTIAKFKTDAIVSSIGATPTDTALPTEKAVKTYADAFAKTLEFTMDTSSYVLTAVLKDAAGTTLSTQTVDLPLETMVTNVEYDNVNQQFVITLKNGTKVYIKATDILRGVVTEAATQTLTNKTIDAASNTLSNIDTTMLASGVLQTTVRAPASALDTAVPSEKAVATALDGKVNIDASATDKTFTLGYDAGGYYLQRTTA